MEDLATTEVTDTTPQLTPTEEALAMDGPLPPTLAADWEAFLAADRSPPGCDAYAEVFAHGTLFPLQRRRELAEMIRTARFRQPAVVAEIGADKGGGFYHWCKALDIRKAICCEIRGTPYFGSFERAFPHLAFQWLPCSSRDPGALRSVGEFLGSDRIDVLFLDGDKGAFLADFDAWLPYMSPEGLVFLHDIQDRPLRDAFDAIRDRGYRCSTILDVSESREAEEREKAGEPILTAHEGWLRHWRGRSCGVGVVELGSD